MRLRNMSFSVSSCQQIHPPMQHKEPWTRNLSPSTSRLAVWLGQGNLSILCCLICLLKGFPLLRFWSPPSLIITPLHHFSSNWNWSLKRIRLGDKEKASISGIGKARLSVAWLGRFPIGKERKTFGHGDGGGFQYTEFCGVDMGFRHCFIEEHFPIYIHIYIFGTTEPLRCSKRDLGVSRFGRCYIHVLFMV